MHLCSCPPACQQYADEPAIELRVLTTSASAKPIENDQFLAALPICTAPTIIEILFESRSCAACVYQMPLAKALLMKFC